MGNAKLREARTHGERLAAILEMAINKKVIVAEDILEIVQPFLDLVEASAEVAHNTAGKVISLALLEKAKLDATARQAAALFAIAEIIRKLELPEMERGAGQ